MLGQEPSPKALSTQLCGSSSSLALPNFSCVGVRLQGAARVVTTEGGEVCTGYLGQPPSSSGSGQWDEEAKAQESG